MYKEGIEQGQTESTQKVRRITNKKFSRTRQELRTKYAEGTNKEFLATTRKYAECTDRAIYKAQAGGRQQYVECTNQQFTRTRQRSGGMQDIRRIQKHDAIS